MRLERLAAQRSGGEDDAPGPATQARPAKDFTQVLKTIQMSKVLPPPTRTITSNRKKRRRIENVFAKSALAPNSDSEFMESNEEAQSDTSTQTVSKISSQESDNKSISSKVSPIVSEPLAEKRAKGEKDFKSLPVLSAETKSKLSSFRRVERSDLTVKSQLQDESGDAKQISSIAALALKKAAKFKETLQNGCYNEKFEDEDEDDFNFCL